MNRRRVKSRKLNANTTIQHKLCQPFSMKIGNNFHSDVDPRHQEINLAPNQY